MDAKKNGSIVKVDQRPYRVIAQENWGLTDDQMKGMHVHHFIPVAQGGTNDPSNLYVCSPSMHRWGWHNGEEFIAWANEGGRLGGRSGGLKGGATNAVSGHCARIARSGGLAGGSKGGLATKKKRVGIFAPGMQSLGGSIGGPRAVEVQRSRGIGLFGLNTEERSYNTRRQWGNPDYRGLMSATSSITGKRNAEKKIGIFAEENLGKGAKTTNSTLWVDPSHPELGAHHFNKLSRLQREQGLPFGKEHRVKFIVRS